MTDFDVPFGPSGQIVYDRTYSRTLADGSKEQWPDTVRRVAKGNLALVHGKDETAWSKAVKDEYNDLVSHMDRFAIIPAGRHLWATGVQGRQYLFNCHVAPWGEKLSRHFEFQFMRLMEGGGVGANYSSRFLAPYGAPRRELRVHIVCDPMHQDYEEMKAAGSSPTTTTPTGPAPSRSRTPARAGPTPWWTCSTPSWTTATSSTPTACTTSPASAARARA